MWLGSIRTALCTFAFIAACLSARSCNLAHSHALLFYCPNTLQSTSMTTYYIGRPCVRLLVRAFVRSFVCSFVCLLVRAFVRAFIRSFVECTA